MRKSKKGRSENYFRRGLGISRADLSPNLIDSTTLAKQGNFIHSIDRKDNYLTVKISYDNINLQRILQNFVCFFREFFPIPTHLYTLFRPKEREKLHE